MNHNDERSCTAHFHTVPVEAETTVESNGCTYLVLRCTICNRPQGLRLVRKSKKVS
jgi:hypothetical protein